MDTLGLGRALVLTTPQQTEQGDAAAAILGQRAAGRFSKARMHVPVDIVDEAGAKVAESGADCLLAIGGGSTTGSPRRWRFEAVCRSSPCRPLTPARK